MLSSVVPRDIDGSRANITVIWVRPKILRHAFRNVQMCNVRDGWPQYLTRRFSEKVFTLLDETKYLLLCKSDVNETSLRYMHVVG